MTHPIVAAAADPAAAATLPEAAALAAEAVALAVVLAADAAELAPAEDADAAAFDVTVAMARASSARKSASEVPVEAEACANMHASTISDFAQTHSFGQCVGADDDRVPRRGGEQFSAPCVWLALQQVPVGSLLHSQKRRRWRRRC